MRITPVPEKTPNQIEWLCEHVAGFKVAYEGVQAVKAHEDEVRQDMARRQDEAATRSTPRP